MKRSSDSKVTVVSLGIRWKISNYPSDFKVLGFVGVLLANPVWMDIDGLVVDVFMSSGWLLC